MPLLCHLGVLLLATSSLGLELPDEPEESMEELEQRLATDIANTAILIGHEVHKPWHLNRGERKRWESHHQRVANDPAGFLLRASRAPRGAANIDWAHWNSRIATPGAVDSFKEAYDNLVVPTLADTFTAEMSSKFDAALVVAEQHAENSRVRIAELEQELLNIEVAKAAIVHQTVDDALDEDPALAAEIEAEIEDNHWK